MTALECGLYMKNTLLRDTDAVSMAVGLEVRVPILDQKVVDFVLSLPARSKVSGDITKWLLRESCRDLIPSSVAGRAKTGFSLPIDRWMHDGLRDSCQHGVEVLAGHGVLDPAEVRNIWDDFIGSSRNAHWTRPMTLVALGKYLDGLKRVGTAGATGAALGGPRSV
jgi:asparagine synthase (glutamine-hydrolysing)